MKSASVLCLGALLLALTALPLRATATAQNNGDDFQAIPDGNHFSYIHYGARWPNGVINWSYNPSGQPTSFSNSDVLAAINTAMRSWTEGCGIQFAYQGETTAAVINKDGISAIGWGDANGYSGYTSFWWNGAMQVTEGDIVLNASKLPRLENLQATMTHEIGHLLGLTHSDQPRSIMFANPYHSTAYQTQPKGDDLSACALLYGSKGVVNHADLSTLAAQATPAYGIKLYVSNSAPTSTAPSASLEQIAADASGVMYFSVYHRNIPVGRALKLRLISPDGYEYSNYSWDNQYASSAYAYLSWDWRNSPSIQRLPGNWQLQLLDENQLIASQGFVVQSDYAVPAVPLLALTAKVANGQGSFAVHLLGSGAPLLASSWMLDQQSLAGSVSGLVTALSSGSHTLWLGANSGNVRYTGSIAGSSSQADGPDNGLRIDQLANQAPKAATFGSTASGTRAALSLDVNVQIADSGVQQLYVAAVLGSSILFKTGNGWSTQALPLLEVSGPGWVSANVLKREDLRSLPSGVPIYAGYGSSVSELLAAARLGVVYTLP